MSKKRKKITTLHWIAGSTIATTVLVIVNIWLALETHRSVSNSKNQFIELNRPYVIIDNEHMDSIGLDRGVRLTNTGSFAAEGLKASMYFFNSQGVKESLINQGDQLPIGDLYPNESKLALMKDPCLLLNTMKDRTFEIELSYTYANRCVTYTQSYNIEGEGNSCSNVRGRDPSEENTKCNINN